jgi:hypothetical protein
MHRENDIRTLRMVTDPKIETRIYPQHDMQVIKMVVEPCRVASATRIVSRTPF